MQRFFLQKTHFDGDVMTITGDDAAHIGFSLRMKPGESIVVCDGDNHECVCEIVSVRRGEVKVKIVQRRDSESEPPCEITLYQAIPKGDKLDFIVQKAVELGACAIVPFASERCVAKIKPDAEEKKLERAKKIACEAAKQCGRGRIPEVRAPLSFLRMLEEASRADIPLFCYEDGGERLRDVLSCPGKTVSVVVGSEGGFTPEEADAAREHGMRIVGLGNRIMRCETAPLFALSCISYEKEI